MENEHGCPLHLAGMLDNWVRKMIHNPKKFLKGLIKSGQSVLDFGCGPGTFTIDMADFVGEAGKVFAVDLQKEMLELVEKKAVKHKVNERVILHQYEEENLRLKEPVDFILAFYVLHDAGERKNSLKHVWNVLKKGGTVLLVEPNVIFKIMDPFVFSLFTP